MLQLCRRGLGGAKARCVARRFSTSRSSPVSASEIPDIVDRVCEFDTFVFDLDGVIIQGGILIPGIQEAICHLQDNDKQIFYLSNNSTKSRRMYAEKLRDLGLKADISNVVNSASATAEYLAEQKAQYEETTNAEYPPVYLLGGPGLQEELTLQDIAFRGPEDDLKTFDDLDFDRHDLNDGTTTVVCGLDTRAGYYKLTKAAAYLRYNDAHFVLTNTDACGPFFPNLMCPGNGSQAAHVTTASGKSPDIIIGKPSQALGNLLITRFGIDASRALMTGDRLDTDVLFGHRAGMSTMLVYSGVTQPHEVEDLLQGQLEDAENHGGKCYPPDFATASVASLATLHM